MIPIHEQPYPLPVGWQWVTLNSIAEIIMGQSPSGDATTDDASYTPLIGGAADMGNDYPSITRYTRKPTKLSEKDDVIICVRATLGKPIFSDGKYCLGRGVAALRPRKVSKNFLRYALINFEQYLYDNANGTTFLQIASKPLKQMPIPLPPLDEQQRIVSLLDELFADLDEAKTLAQAVVDGSKLRRAAILHKAFTGELSQLWRDEHGTTLDSWQRTFWGKCGTFIAGSAFKKDFQGLQDYEIPFYKVSSLKFADDGGYLFDKSDTINEDICKELKAKLIPPNSLLFAKIGEAIRLNRRALNRVPCCIDNNMMAFIPEKILLRYAFHWSRSVNLYEYTNATTVPAIRKSDLEKIPVPLPPLEEQKEIVRLLDDLLGREQRTKDVALKTVERVELMKKSILARAFRGELNTNKILQEM